MAPVRKNKSPRKNSVDRPSSAIVVDTSLRQTKVKMPRAIQAPLPTDRQTRSTTKLADATTANSADVKAKAVLKIQDFPSEVRRQIFEELIGGYVIDIKFDEVAPGKFELDKTAIPEFDVQIARVCKTWAAEAIPVLYGKNVFSIQDLELFDRKFLSCMTPANKQLIKKIAVKENPCELPVQVEMDQLLRLHPEFYYLQSIDVTLVHCCRFLSQFNTEVMAKQATKERIMWSLYRLMRRFPGMTTMVEKTQGFDGHICLGIRVKGVKISGTEIRHLKTEEKFYEDLKARVPDMFFPFRLAPL